MRYLRLLAMVWACGLMVAASVDLAAAAEYTIIDALDASAINAWGAIVGNGCFATPQCSAAVNGNGPYLLIKSVYSPLAFPPTVLASNVTGINAWGDVVGFYLDSDLKQHGFLLRKGVFKSIDAPGASSQPFLGTTANGINAWGEIVGQYFHDNGAAQDFLLRHFFPGKGDFINFDVPIPGSLGDTPNDISARGDIVGSYTDSSGGSHGFLLRKGAVNIIDFPGAESSAAQGINSQGDIVGSYSVAIDNNPFTNSYSYGFLLRHGTFTTINPPGPIPFDGVQAAALGINEAGAIVGYFNMATGPGSAQTLGFLRSK